jgi:hypothetical protein
MLALSLISRNYALVISAVIFINTVNFEELIMYFMQAWRLPVTLGYPLLSTVNAFHNIRQELTRIQNAQLMRYGCKKFSLRICYPMLVSISRYAFYNGLSMTCRGLNRQKTFIQPYPKWQHWHSVSLSVNSLILLGILFYLT